MYDIIATLVRTLRLLLDAVQFLMMLRAVLSWIPTMGDNAVVNFIYSVTEPIITPVRSFMERFNIMQGLPIDTSFMVTFFIIIIIRSLLPVI
ncbi:MAG: YggT family protein [Ruminococcaceae bacterium]|nr:YggT family protein [Oscillospiraceae bacterium]